MDDGLTYVIELAGAVGLLCLLGVVALASRARWRGSIDPDAGVWSRAHLERRLSEEVARSSRTGVPFAFLVLEVPGVGARGRDVAEVADALRATCRSSDVVGRFHEDAFVVIATATDGHGALALAGRLRSGLVIQYVHERRSLPPSAISVGVTQLEPSRKSTPDAIVAAAGSALEVARGRGGDCVVLVPAAAPSNDVALP